MNNPTTNSPSHERPSEILDKIKKLLRRGHSPFPSEAATAIRKAKELADLHRIDIASLKLGDKEDEIIHRYFHVGNRLSLQKQIALSILNNHFNVSVCLAGDRVCFVGREVDVMIAEYILDFLVGSAGRCLSQFKKDEKSARRKVTTNKNRNFLYGWKYGVVAQLSEHKAERLDKVPLTTALAIQEDDKRRQAYFAELFPDIRKKSPPKMTRTTDALSTGFLAGKKTRIRKPIDCKNPTMQLH